MRIIRFIAIVLSLTVGTLLIELIIQKVLL